MLLYAIAEARVHTEVGMKKYGSKKEQLKNELEKYFNLY